ncbi:MAG: hypothetical protein KDA32_01360 [Phycisphaerales bacterium]|nr:hypothetical protein [Phycisphaerales bacterium]
MEASGGMLSRISEKVIAWIAFGLLVLLGVTIYQMPAETKSAIWSGLWRTIAFIGISAAWPWQARLYIRRVLEVGENWAGAALIAALTLGNVIIGVVLMTVWPGSGWAWMAAIGAIALTGTYNYLVTSYLADMSGH